MDNVDALLEPLVAWHSLPHPGRASLGLTEFPVQFPNTPYLFRGGSSSLRCDRRFSWGLVRRFGEGPCEALKRK